MQQALAHCKICKYHALHCHIDVTQNWYSANLYMLLSIDITSASGAVTNRETKEGKTRRGMMSINQHQGANIQQTFSARK